jgi:hypothetical protein
VLRQEDDQLLEPAGKSGKDFDVVVLTQMLGRDYGCDWLLEWRRENPDLLVINDRVQGGRITQEDTRCASVGVVVVRSAGLALALVRVLASI